MLNLADACKVLACGGCKGTGRQASILPQFSQAYAKGFPGLLGGTRRAYTHYAVWLASTQPRKMTGKAGYLMDRLM